MKNSLFLKLTVSLRRFAVLLSMSRTRLLYLNFFGPFCSLFETVFMILFSSGRVVFLGIIFVFGISVPISNGRRMGISQLEFLIFLITDRHCGFEIGGWIWTR